MLGEARRNWLRDEGAMRPVTSVEGKAQGLSLGVHQRLNGSLPVGHFKLLLARRSLVAWMAPPHEVAGLEAQPAA